MTAPVNPSPAPASMPPVPPVATAPHPSPSPVSAPPSAAAPSSPVAAVAAPAQSQSNPVSAGVPTGFLRRVGAVSINLHPIANSRPQPSAATTPAPPLTQELLMEHWGAMLQQLQSDNSKLAEILKGREIRLQEEQFDIVVPNSFIESEIKPHLTRLLESLRKATGHPLLNGHVLVEYEEREAVVYAPHDKYQVMLNANPALASFLTLFPDLDY